MKNPYADMNCLVYDRGQFTYIAEKLAESFGNVKYFCPINSVFPTSDNGLVAMGLPNIDRVFEFWTHVDDADLIVMPDVYDGDVADYCRQLGKPVWGAGHTAKLELDREYFHTVMKALGQPVAETEVIIGCDSLQEYLEEHEEVFVKTSFFRGDFETYEHINWELTRPWLDKLRVQLGPRQHIIHFLVEQPIDGKEAGYDGYHVNGQLSPVCMYGYEKKNLAYIGKNIELDELPEPLYTPTAAYAKLLNGVSCQMHNEVRVTKEGVAYLTDPTMRCGSPPSESMIEAFSNWTEVIYEGAHGNLVPLEPVARYAVMLTISSAWLQENWLAVKFPDKIRQWVKIYQHCMIQGVDYSIPDRKHPEFASVVGVGNTVEAAIKHCFDNKEQIEALQMSTEDDAFNDIMKEIEEGREYGIDW